MKTYITHESAEKSSKNSNYVVVLYSGEILLYLASRPGMDKKV